MRRKAGDSSPRNRFRVAFLGSSSTAGKGQAFNWIRELSQRQEKLFYEFLNFGFAERGHPAEAAPSLGALLIMFVAAFGWIVFLTTVMPSIRTEVRSEPGELDKPLILNYCNKLGPGAISSPPSSQAVLGQVQGLR